MSATEPRRTERRRAPRHPVQGRVECPLLPHGSGTLFTLSHQGAGIRYHGAAHLGGEELFRFVVLGHEFTARCRLAYLRLYAVERGPDGGTRPIHEAGLAFVHLTGADQRTLEHLLAEMKPEET